MGKFRRTSPQLIRLSEIEKFFELRAPAGTAERWDNVGLLVGDPATVITGVVISDDLTAESLTLAKRVGANLIVNHHPCLFPKKGGIARVTAVGETSLVHSAASSAIAVFASHTNFDQCALEVPRAVSEALGFRAEGRLHDVTSMRCTKLVAFVPQSHVEQVRDALASAGAGRIGNYDSCSFASAGEGAFRALEGAQPFLGSVGKLERAKEVRLETIFPSGLKKPVMRALRESHPYEEIAYDLYAVEQTPSGIGITPGMGYGVFGTLPKRQSIRAILARTEKAFATRGALLTPASPTASRIAFVAGKGTAFLANARAQGCDLFITGEAGYHDARMAAENGMSVLELGHRESEYFFLRTVESWMRSLGLPVDVLNTPIQRFV